MAAKGAINSNDAKKIEMLLQNVFNETVAIIRKGDWTYIKNKDVYYNNKVVAIFPNLKTFGLGFCTSAQQKFDSQTFKNEFGGFKGDIMTLEEFRKTFAANSREFFAQNFGWQLKNNFTVKIGNQYRYATINPKSPNTTAMVDNNIYNIPIFRLNQENSPTFDAKYIVEFLLTYGLMPNGLKPQLEKIYGTLVEFYHKKYITVVDGVIKITEEAIKDSDNEQPKQIKAVEQKPVVEEVVEEKVEPVEEVVEEKSEPEAEEVIEEKPEPIVEEVAEEKPEPIVEEVAEEKPEPVAEEVVEEKPEPIVEEVTEEKPEPIVEEVTEEKPEPVAEEVVEEKPEPIVEEVTEEKHEPIVQEVTEEKPEPVAEEVVEEKSEPIVEEVVEQKPEPVVEEVVEQEPEPVVEEVVEQKPEPEAEEVVEQKPEPVAEEVIEQKPEPNIEEVTEEPELVVEQVAEQEVEPAVEEILEYPTELESEQDMSENTFEQQTEIEGEQMSKLEQENTIDETKNISDIEAESIECDSKNEIEILKEKLLNCDNLRCDLESYKEKMLTDINRGHWDLWEEHGKEDADTVITENGFVARNPKLDIKYNGTIAIDFGTKSTIVVSQKNNREIMPIRIGTGHLNKKVEAKHYENPTVMELRNLESFLEKYSQKKGRPETLWEDLTTSHTAASSLFASNSSEEFYAHINDLKQWARDKKIRLKLKDKSGKYISLPPFLDIKDGEFDPIEVYAYYIGLYINNMHNGNNIYLDYILSFPVTFEESIQNKIIESFSRGLKKSFPISILKDDEVMKNFRVSVGASEPVAYAICALNEYGFEPEGNEKIFYGVFDFGGGTTDFDFGIWHEADIYEDRYDYVLEHLNSGGDEYLGGENLLELLSFEVFKFNQDKLRNDGITFLLPRDCKSFEGSEMLLEDTQEARLNMVQLMERLRPLWEQQKDYESNFEDNKIKVDLFNNVGERKLAYELVAPVDELMNIIENRIEKGVRSFFEGLNIAFKKLDLNDIECVNIFLAGNSSKSPVVENLFKKYIDNEVENIFRGRNKNNMFKMLFKVFPPLGTEEAQELQRNFEADFEENSIRPTGKTGVAFGLIMSRKGSNIKIVNHNDKMFNYYIGHNKKKRFVVVSDTQVEYNKWIRFIDAGTEDFTLYYTGLTEASTNKLDIKETNMKKCRIDKIDEKANVYYRIVGATAIEYTVATPDEIEDKNYSGDVTRLELN